MKRKAIILALVLGLSSIFISCEKQADANATPSELLTVGGTTVTPNVTTPTTDNNDDTKTPTETTANQSTDESTNEVETTDSDAVMKESRLFYFNISDYKLYYIDKKVPVKENAYVKALTEAVQKNPDSQNFISLTDQVMVSSATLDSETGILKVVFNDDYTNSMNMGSAIESGLLTSLINTYGYNYGVDKVAIYFGDQLYTAQVGDLPQGYFDVTIEGAVEYNKN